MDDVEKTQLIRILDVVGIGPLMIYAGAKTKEELPGWVRAALILSGITTIGYNGANYLKQREQDDTLDDRLQAMLDEAAKEE